MTSPTRPAPADPHNGHDPGRHDRHVDRDRHVDHVDHDDRDRHVDHDDRDRHDDHVDHDDFGGFSRDLRALVGRRRALQLLGGAGLAGLAAACGSSASSSSTTASSAGPSSTSSTAGGSSTTAAAGATTTAGGAGAAIPSETQGPYPADGSNGPNILSQAGIVRSDITTSVGSLSGTATGVPMTIQLSVVNASTGAAVPGAAVYVWHCTAQGRYSVYELSDQNYLRGVQAADSAGRVTFTSIFPGCYRGRWPHVHFEVYSGLDQATAGSKAVKTSQLALPEADCRTVYADSRYGSSSSNLSGVSLKTDNVFSDGWSAQLATVSGSVNNGYVASLLVRI